MFLSLLQSFSLNFTLPANMVSRVSDPQLQASQGRTHGRGGGKVQNSVPLAPNLVM